jgi:hypothetical protein
MKPSYHILRCGKNPVVIRSWIGYHIRHQEKIFRLAIISMN